MFRPHRLIIIAILLAIPCMAAQDQYFNSNGVKIRYTVQGAGEPVILIHGYTVNQEAQWVVTGVLPKLAQHYRVIALDNRGHGKSDKPHDPSAYGPQMAMDVIRLMDYLRIPRAHIIGYSMGSMINAWLLSEHPERYLTCILGGGAGMHWDRPYFVNTQAGYVAQLERGDMAQRWIALHDDRLAILAVARSFPALKWDEARMRKVRVPVLAVDGDNDPGLDEAEDLTLVLPSVKLVIIPGATHAGPTGALYRPEFMAAVLSFLAAHRQGAVH